MELVSSRLYIVAHVMYGPRLREGDTDAPGPHLSSGLLGARGTVD
jgi:hypothetical protein